MPGNEEGGPPERPDYKIYRARRGIFSRWRAPDLGALRDRLLRRGPSEHEPDKPRLPEEAPGERPWWRRALKWVGLAALGWILLSLLAFGVSAQIQKAKLADGVTDALGFGNPLLVGFAQTMLVIGTDIRSEAFGGPAEEASEECLDAATSGEAPPAGCPTYRADTLMLVRAGGGVFRKLSIPRDTLAEIPGQGAEKINAAYAFGGAELQVETVEDFLGLEIDQVAIVDFEGFREFIDTIGGVEVDLPTDVCVSISDGAFNLDLEAGEQTLNGFQAITLARTRTNTCGEGQFSGTDIERTEFQQVILDGIKGRLTDPLRAPINFLKGPIIGWNAPRALVSSMGAFTMPQLVLAAGFGVDDGSDILEPTSLGNPLVVSEEECARAARDLLGEPPPRPPACSP
jgi:LCP family protein required for cell wall assembly